MIRGAEAEDCESVEALLVAAGLPVAGVDEHLSTFFVADDGGRIVGVAGLELYGESALLRSVVVVAEGRGTGLGLTLVRRVLDEALAQGARDAYLLTTTAERFFPRFGFTRTERQTLPEALLASHELRGACPVSAIVMRRRLLEADGTNGSSVGGSLRR